MEALHSTEIKTEDGITYAKTTIYDDAALARTKALRDADVLKNGELALHDKADLRLVVSCPSVLLWNIFKKKHQATYKLLMSKLEAERMKGARQLSFLHPNWVIQDRL